MRIMSAYSSVICSTNEGKKKPELVMQNLENIINYSYGLSFMLRSSLHCHCLEVRFWVAKTAEAKGFLGSLGSIFVEVV